MFYKDVWTIPCGYGASNTEGEHQVELRQQPRITSDLSNPDFYHEQCC